MDFATIIGILSGVGLILYAIVLGSGIGLFFNVQSIMIVGGGTIAALFVAYPIDEVLRVFSTIKRVFLFKKEDTEALIIELTRLALFAKKQGILSLEAHRKKISNKQVKRGIGLISDGIDRDTIQKILTNEIINIQKQHATGRQMFIEMGKYAPAFGMVGTLIGLIQMLANLENSSSIGPNMAVALLTTFYGAFIANVLFIPMAVKLKQRSEIEGKNMAAIMEGILSIQKGENPTILKNKLTAYFDENSPQKPTKKPDKKTEKKDERAKPVKKQ